MKQDTGRMRCFLLSIIAFLLGSIVICAFHLKFIGSRGTAGSLTTGQAFSENRRKLSMLRHNPSYPTTVKRLFPRSQETSLDNSHSGWPLKIVISGAPASGKGTHSEMISTNLGVVHLSTGELLRASMRANTPLGNEVRVYMDQSKLVPDDIMIRVVTERLMQNDCKQRGWILDGFPRTEVQAQAMLQLGIRLDSFILLDVPENILFERVVGRRTDPITGKVYHLKFNPPDNDEIAQRLIQRSDDTIERTQRRIKDYQTHTAAVRTYFEDVMLYINGTATREQITSTILTTLNKIKIDKSNSNI